MRVRLALLCAAAAASPFVPASDPADGASCNRTRDVSMGDRDDGDLFFSPTRVTIRAGSCVRWTWKGMLDHELEGAGLNSPVRTAPYRFRKRYSRARDRAYRVICTIHPLSRRMWVKVLPRS